MARHRAATMIIATYPHKRTVSRLDCHDLRVRKRGKVAAHLKE
jgi:hypothetical protein